MKKEWKMELLLIIYISFLFYGVTFKTSVKMCVLWQVQLKLARFFTSGF